ncbi:MAG TPA: STAS domain-containing protein [Gemmataceae bacterium]|nr:STAS domain-containing protein [Gemmataceae bacterium]
MPLTSACSLLRVTEEQGRTVARFTNCTILSGANAEEVGRQLTALVEGREAPQLALDLGDIDMLTSMALAKFISLNGRLRARGGRLTLFNLKPVVRQVFAVTKLDGVLDVRDAPESLSV